MSYFSKQNYGGKTKYLEQNYPNAEGNLYQTQSCSESPVLRWCKHLDRQPGEAKSIGSQLREALVPMTVVSIRNQGKFYPWKEALRKQTFWPRPSLAACPLSPARWCVLALTAIASPGPAPHATTTFFCTVHLNKGLSNSGHEELISPLGLWLLYLDERCAWAPLKGRGNKHPQNGPKGAHCTMGVQSPPSELVCFELHYQGTLSIIKSLFHNTVGFLHSSQMHFLWVSDILMCSGTTP